jgi:hypothetical protein
LIALKDSQAVEKLTRITILQTGKALTRNVKDSFSLRQFSISLKQYRLIRSTNRSKTFGDMEFVDMRQSSVVSNSSFHNTTEKSVGVQLSKQYRLIRSTNRSKRATAVELSCTPTDFSVVLWNP